MKFHVDGWDPGYGPAFEAGELAESSATVDTTMEVSAAQWAPQPLPDSVKVPEVVLFVDGVRRIDARVWINNETGDNATIGMCASYAAGVICSSGGVAEVVSAEVRRGLYTESREATHIVTDTGRYVMTHVVADPASPASGALSNALQRDLTDLEKVVADDARDAGASDDDLLIIDGPIRERAQIPRALGYIKTHGVLYLPPELNAIVPRLDVCERTPVFSIATGWQRYSWYLRLPCERLSPWAGIVRLEAWPKLDISEVVELANLSQALLGRYASEEYKESRAPQNLFPIAGLEKDLRHRLGSAPLLYRKLRSASHR